MPDLPEVVVTDVKIHLEVHWAGLHYGDETGGIFLQAQHKSRVNAPYRTRHVYSSQPDGWPPASGGSDRYHVHVRFEIAIEAELKTQRLDPLDPSSHEAVIRRVIAVPAFSHITHNS